jgi:hypothetical protein
MYCTGYIHFETENISPWVLADIIEEPWVNCNGINRKQIETDWKIYRIQTKQYFNNLFELIGDNFLQGKLKPFTCSAHYVECRIGSYKTYTSVEIMLQKCNYWVFILSVIYWDLYILKGSQ